MTTAASLYQRNEMVDGSLRNQWTTCSGIGGWIQSESVDAFNRNRWTESAGIRIVGLPAWFESL